MLYKFSRNLSGHRVQTSCGKIKISSRFDSAFDPVLSVLSNGIDARGGVPRRRNVLKGVKPCNDSANKGGGCQVSSHVTHGRPFYRRVCIFARIAQRGKRAYTSLLKCNGFRIAGSRVAATSLGLNRHRKISRANSTVSS